MWTVISVLIFVNQVISGKLIGDHICQEEQRYTINVTEHFVRNATVRKYKWCLNVPPRCSFYTTRLVNDTRIVEKEVTDLIEKCCEGFIQDELSNNCVPLCPKCINGKCVERRCFCSAGFKGEHCDIGCDSQEWGENCKFKCTCNNGTCDSITGTCVCPAGWTGTECQFPCSRGLYGNNCQEKCSCDDKELCHHVTGQCESPLTTTISTTTAKISPLKDDLQKNVFLNNHDKYPTKTTIPSNKNNIISFENNGKFQIDKSGMLSTTSFLGVESTHFTTDKSETNKMSMTNFMLVHQFKPLEEDQVDDNNDEQQYINFLTTKQSVQRTNPSKTTSNVKKISTTETNNIQEENYINDESRKGNINQSISKSDLINGASAATAISVAVVIIAIAIVTTNHFKKHKNNLKGESERNKGVPTVSVYAHSIFHTPLPEPPTFENPIFITPLDTNSNNEGQRFETRVVCSMNFPGHSTKDPREYLYDHPPSTGSYRAASEPEPPDIDINSLQSLPHTEPLYDEIPSGMTPTPISQPPPPYKTSSLYMNTCGKTRL